MSPDRSQGAGQSIEDAVVLAAALRRYDTERRPRTQATVRGARKDGARATSPAANRLVVPMLRLMLAALWRKGLSPNGNSIWRWQPPRLPVRKP
ncbi:hypothetical protein [Streptosporangium sp. NBC_01810]|nr:hypothetical protein [Streptosporangium sp. NBC_01810]